MGELRICFVSKNPCIRVVKQAYALWHCGFKPFLVAPRLQDIDPFSVMAYFKSPKQLEDVVLALKGSVDVFVVHNEPSWPAMIIRNALPESKIVMDVHDSLYWYDTSEKDSIAIGEKTSWYEEDYSMSVCDGFVVPSEACRDELKKRHDKPIAVVPPACPKYDYRFQYINFKGGLVSQGGHMIPENQKRPNEYWRDYTKLYKYLNGRCDVHVYTPNIDNLEVDPENKVYKHYSQLVTSIEKVPYEVLLNKIGQHSWNLVGNWCKHVVWDYCAPNKFYDALSAGTPNVVFHVKHAIDLIEEYGFGISIEHPSELIERWPEHSEKRLNVMKHRDKVSLEKFIGRAVDLYKEVIRG